MEKVTQISLELPPTAIPSKRQTSRTKLTLTSVPFTRPSRRPAPTESPPTAPSAEIKATRRERRSESAKNLLAVACSGSGLDPRFPFQLVRSLSCADSSYPVELGAFCRLIECNREQLGLGISVGSSSSLTVLLPFGRSQLGKRACSRPTQLTLSFIRPIVRLLACSLVQSAVLPIFCVP